VLTTAGNLVFQGTADGRLVAYRADDGAPLWQAPAQTGVIAPPVTYTVDGEQYITVMAGWGGAFALVFGRAAKAAGVRNLGRVLTFKLGGDAVLPPPIPAKAAPPPPPMTATVETVTQGEALYYRHCVACHGIGAVSGGVIADLRNASPQVHEAWEDIVLRGIYRGKGMAGFFEHLSPEGAQAIRAYVVKRAHEGDKPN
jgi:quinohemoprotein ethanol dehydrogenase